MSAPGNRLTLTDILYIVEYGYWVPRPKERSARANLVYAFDIGTWIFLSVSLALLMVAEGSFYLTNGLHSISWVEMHSIHHHDTFVTLTFLIHRTSLQACCLPPLQLSSKNCTLQCFQFIMTSGKWDVLLGSAGSPPFSW